MTRERAVEIAKQMAEKYLPPDVRSRDIRSGKFVPHDWVVEAILAAVAEATRGRD